VAPGAALIGDVEIGPLASVWFGCVVRGDVHQIRIGARTNVQDGTIIHATRDRFATLIGEEVTIGHRALVHGCTLEDRAFIGMGATVMDGATVESTAMLAAGALLTPGKRIPAGQLWTGTPARYARDLSADEIAVHAEQNLLYVELGREYRGS
jgi:carbonic anhydrase/acetyltransferase-like protein (isoleucine patch superfamily)